MDAEEPVGAWGWGAPAGGPRSALPTARRVLRGLVAALSHRIYRYQSHDFAFSSVERLLHSLGGDDFLGMLNRTLLETLQRAGFSEKFLEEIVAPVMRVNYGQSMNINGFVGKSRPDLGPGRGDGTCSETPVGSHVVPGWVCAVAVGRGRGLQRFCPQGCLAMSGELWSRAPLSWEENGQGPFLE